MSVLYSLQMSGQLSEPIPMSEFKNSPIAPSGSSTTEGRVPLTALQRGKLLADCIPFIFFVAALLFSLVMLDDILGQAVPILIPAFLALVVLVTGFTAVQRLRDFVSGLALVKEDRLERSWRSRGSGGGFHGKFDQLGRMRMMRNAHFQARNNGRHRVTYSPASKIVWSAEPLDS